MILKLERLFIIFFLAGCVEPLNIEGEPDGNLLVVEGFISTEQKEYEISLFRTAKFGSIFTNDGLIQSEEGADVFIRDNTGLMILLDEKGDGKYTTSPNFKAIVGRSYSLLIELESGAQYISSSELIRPPVPINSVTSEYSEIPNSDESVSTGFEVSVNFEDQQDKNFYLWDAEGLYELTSNPEKHELPPPPGGIDPIPDPKSCCPRCYRTEEFDLLKFDSDKLFNGIQSTKNVLFIEDDGIRFVNEKYLVRIKQYTISPETFQFFSLLETQLGISGDIFDSPPATIRGNLIRLDKPEEPVIGQFWAASVAIDSTFMFSADRLVKQRVDTVKDDCRELSGTTLERPSFW